MTDTFSLYTSTQKQNLPREKHLSIVLPGIIKQELKTYIQTEGGLKIVTRERKFRNSTHDEVVSEEILELQVNNDYS